MDDAFKDAEVSGWSSWTVNGAPDWSVGPSGTPVSPFGLWVLSITIVGLKLAAEPPPSVDDDSVRLELWHWFA